MHQVLRSNLILIGCGPHYQKKYHAVLEKHGAKIALLIDLQANQDQIELFFQDKALRPNNVLFLPEDFRNTITPQDIDVLIRKQIDLSTIDGVIICTEPKARKAYTIWSVENGIPVFMDKPVSAFSNLAEIGRLLEDYEEIARAAGQVDIVVSTERRAHPGYLWIKEYLNKFIDEIKVPITGIDIHFAGGVSVLPQEYLLSENHPFKHGYGVLLHSGYHYVDLVTTFLSLNHPFINPDEMKYNLKVLVSRPADQLAALGTLSEALKLNHLGETDILLIGQVEKDGHVLTNFSLKLFGTSVSTRKEKVKSPYECTDGRVRQEHVTLHLGHMCSLNMMSNPLKKFDPKGYPLEDFTITIMNNPALESLKPVITLDRKGISQLFPEISEQTSLNEDARKWQLVEFLHGRDGNSPFRSHKNTVRLLHAIYSQIQSDSLVDRPDIYSISNGRVKGYLS